MIRAKFVLTVVLFAALPVGVMAQGSGSTASKQDFNVTRSVQGKVTGVHLGPGHVVIKDESGERFMLQITDKTKFTSDKPGAAKNVKLKDLQVGQRVKATYAADTEQVIELRLIG